MSSHRRLRLLPPKRLPVSHHDVDHFFNEYVYGFMAADVSREVDAARLGNPSANLLRLPQPWNNSSSR